MRRPRVVVLRGHSANPWELRPWELLADRFDVRVLATGSNAFDLDSLDAFGRARSCLARPAPARRAGDVGALALGDRYLGLEAALRGADVVHAAEIGVPYSHGPALLKASSGFQLVLTVWETIPFGDAYRRFRGRRQRRETLAARRPLPRHDRARPVRRCCSRARPTDRIEVAPPGRRHGALRVSGRARLAPRPLGRAARLGEGPPGLLRALAWLRAGRPRRARADRRRGPGRAAAAGARRATSASARHVEWRASVPYDEMPARLRARRRASSSPACRRCGGRSSSAWCSPRRLPPALPIVAAASGAIPEVLRGAGTLFPAGDWQALAAELA